MTGRSARPWLALAVSLLLHGSLLGGLVRMLPQWDAPPPAPVFEARLVPLPPAPAIPPPSPVRRTLPQQVPPPRLPAPTAAPTPQAQSDEVVAPAVLDEAGLDGIAAAPAGEAATPEPVPDEAASAEIAPPPLNALPPRLDLRYQVRYGLVSGEQVLQWVNEGERYTLSSVASATGLAGVFYRGRFVQTSRGRITPQGLQPEEFWDQRGDRHSSARFDAAAGRITLMPAKGAPRHFGYAGEVQDALSLFFQLALTAPPPAGRFTYAVFNGKKLRDYSYEVLGEETLETALGALRTLHLARTADADGRFEAWLAVDRHYLPVRVLKSDDTGNAMELRIQSIAP